MARLIELSLMVSDGARTKPHVHGVEPRWGSKFWTNGDEDDSTVASDDEDITSPTLVSEALAAGFTVDQIHQAEPELQPPTSSTTEAGAKVSETSLSKQIVNVWVNNHSKKIKPWKGPLPPPRQSPPRTLGDALAKAKVETKSKALISHVAEDFRQGTTSPQSSSTSLRQSPMMVVNPVGGSPRLNSQASTGVLGEVCYNRSAGKRSSASPVARTSRSLSVVDTTPDTGFQISNKGLHGGNHGDLDPKVNMVYKGCHTNGMGLDQTPKKPRLGYCPTPRLISMFSRTGVFSARTTATTASFLCRRPTLRDGGPWETLCEW
jgi:hypothetical protein